MYAKPHNCDDKNKNNCNARLCVTCRDGPEKNGGFNQCISSYTVITRPGLCVQQL